MSRFSRVLALLSAIISVSLIAGCAESPTEVKPPARLTSPARLLPLHDGTDTLCRNGFTVPGGRSC
jgi:hypothetical protein